MLVYDPEVPDTGKSERRSTEARTGNEEEHVVEEGEEYPAVLES